ncbi:MAG: hypothetical protein QM778_09495 [Myxococcales bacterium]
MRGNAPPANALAHTAWLCCLVAASCTPGARLAEPHPQPGVQPASIAAPARGELRHALELASLLPNEAARCVVAIPSALPEPVRPLMGLVSQTDHLPWGVDLPVLAYVRAEVTTADERSLRVDYLRFATRDAQRIRDAVSKADDRELSWGTAPPSCGGELTCVAVAAEFVDPYTVRLSTGKLPEDFEFDVGNGRCLALLQELPDAVEVSARQGAGLFDSRELVGSESALFLRTRSIERLTRRHFLSPALAARAARKLAVGTEDNPMFAGTPLRSEYRVQGAVLEQRSGQSLEELWLSVEDQDRLQRALAAERTAEEGAIDPDESFERVAPERVLAHVDQALSRLPPAPAVREAELHRLDRMLTRARTEAPNHEALARRQFTLRCQVLGDGRSALELADARLASGGEVAYWQLARRTALARFDTHRLAWELQRQLGLSNTEATRAAPELAQQVQAGQDYERAEWALVTASSLLGRVRGVRRTRVPELRLPLAQVPRLFAYWARLGRAAEGHDLGVHLLAFGARTAAPLPADAQHWAQDTKVQGRAASVFAAATWEDEALVNQGSALAQHFAPGAFELLVGIEQLDASRRGALVSLSGRLEGGDLVVEEISANLVKVRWELVVRTLLEPLQALRGSVFPPDELVVGTHTPAELESARRAAETAGDLVCSNEGLMLRCRGGVGDLRAATRGLLRTARALLGPDANALWSGAD